MPTQYSIQTDIDLVNTVKTVTQVYQEIAVMKMQRVRGSVLVTRDYLEKLSEIFYEVKRSYNRELNRLLEKEKKQNKEVKQDKELSILISPNTKLYGEVVYKVVKLFIEDIKKSKSEIGIIGRLGKDLFDNEKIERQYTYFEIPDSEIRMEDLRAIIAYIASFEKINVYYPRFENVVSQKASISNLSGDAPLKEGEGLNYRERAYLFEPNLEKILLYFRNQMISSLFKQTVHESQLARFASRIRAMEEALDHIDVRSRQLTTEQRRMKKIDENKKQLERISGMTLWSK